MCLPYFIGQSEVLPHPEKHEGIEVHELVKSYPDSFTVPDLKQLKNTSTWSKKGPKSLVLISEGQVSAEDLNIADNKNENEKNSSFRVALAGDTNFLLNQDFISRIQ